ncbi:MAG: DUF2203 domain-containing protein [Bacteroidetes bacterium]|nr:DUF2203 domain-containing protein [Bacteroidota bacterium]
MTDTAIKYWSPKEAEKTLPLVKQIVRDILEKGYMVKTIAESLGGEITENTEAQKYISEINGFIKELEEIGCSFKDWNFSIGLVDFPALINGEEVELCWRSDEENILYYHTHEEGYKGRKRIPEELLN